jgi:hypothetical protein
VQQPVIIRDELEGLKRELGSQARVAHALGRSEEWTSRTLSALSRGEQPRLELKTELAIHYLYSFVVFASKRLGPDVRTWIFVPRVEFGHSEAAELLRQGRIHEVIELLQRELGYGPAESQAPGRPQLRRSVVFKERQRPRRIRLRKPEQPVPSFEELDKLLAGKRLDLEGVIYGRV